MITIVDYGVGNLFSLSSSLNYLGLENRISGEKSDLASADRLILPGVGAFADAMEKLKASGLIEPLKEEIAKGKPLLGICLGMQLLFEKSYEYGEHEGLGLLRGEVVPLKKDMKEQLKIPHMGWNSLQLTEFGRNHPLLRYTKEGDYVYFVHSFYAVHCEDSLLAFSEYGTEVTAAVAHNHIMGTQFHPEKSGETGLRILKAFAEI